VRQILEYDRRNVVRVSTHAQVAISLPLAATAVLGIFLVSAAGSSSLSVNKIALMVRQASIEDTAALLPAPIPEMERTPQKKALERFVRAGAVAEVEGPEGTKGLHDRLFSQRKRAAYLRSLQLQVDLLQTAMERDRTRLDSETRIMAALRRILQQDPTMVSSTLVADEKNTLAGQEAIFFLNNQIAASQAELAAARRRASR
jgi:hypothetical protein